MWKTFHGKYVRNSYINKSRYRLKEWRTCMVFIVSIELKKDFYK